jgi:membrane associated rhomboid family serine protease
MFMHGGWMHLAGNMLFLWIFGDNLEDMFGHVGFLIFYLVCGVAADMAHILPDPNSQVPLVGASGAIAGVMGGYLLLFPKARVDVLLIFIVFFRVFSLAAWIVLMAWFGMQIFSGMNTPTAGGGVAYWAHAGGFVAGVLLSLPIFLKQGGTAFWERTEGHPDHPPQKIPERISNIPVVQRRRK